MFQNLNYKLQKTMSNAHPTKSSKATQMVLGELHEDKSCDILQGRAPTNVITVHETSLGPF